MGETALLKFAEVNSATKNKLIAKMAALSPQQSSAEAELWYSVNWPSCDCAAELWRRNWLKHTRSEPCSWLPGIAGHWQWVRLCWCRCCCQHGCGPSQTVCISMWEGTWLGASAASSGAPWVCGWEQSPEIWLAPSYLDKALLLGIPHSTQPRWHSEWGLCRWEDSK